MYAHIAQAGWRHYAAAELPSLVGALAIAELFYKFHSFTLECLAFLVTWFLLSWIHTRLRALFGRH